MSFFYRIWLVRNILVTVRIFYKKLQDLLKGCKLLLFFLLVRLSMLLLNIGTEGVFVHNKNSRALAFTMTI